MEILERAIQDRIGSGLAAAAGALDSSSSILQWPEVYLGETSHDLTSHDLTDAIKGPITPATKFDLASLTKILSITSLFMNWVDGGRVDLDQSLEHFLPEVTARHAHLKPLTLFHLLSHTSGLPAWKPFYEEMRVHFGDQLPFLPIAQRKDYFFELVFSTMPEISPGTKAVYSDLGFLILGAVAEKIGGKSLDQLAHEIVWNPIGTGLQYRPVVTDTAGERARIRQTGESVAATEDCPWRGLVQGQVHDDNAWSMGGVAGHAGVFGTLIDVKRWAQALLDGKIASPAVLKKFTTEVRLNDGSPSGRALGFDLPAKDGSGSTADAFFSTAIGHLGFTGTSIWLDLDQGRGAILLTNRVHPSRDDLRIRNLRREFHSQIG